MLALSVRRLSNLGLKERDYMLRMPSVRSLSVSSHPSCSAGSALSYFVLK